MKPEDRIITIAAWFARMTTAQTMSYISSATYNQVNKYPRTMKGNKGLSALAEKKDGAHEIFDLIGDRCFNINSDPLLPSHSTSGHKHDSFQDLWNAIIYNDCTLQDKIGVIGLCRSSDSCSAQCLSQWYAKKDNHGNPMKWGNFQEEPDLAYIPLYGNSDGQVAVDIFFSGYLNRCSSVAACGV